MKVGVHKAGRTTLLYILFFACISLLLPCCGGVLVILLEDRVAPVTKELVVLGLVISVTATGALLSSRRILGGCTSPSVGETGGSEQSQAAVRRIFLFNVALFALLSTVSLVLMNLAASFYSVPWPLNGLHGVTPSVGKIAWGGFNKINGAVLVNSWGQRDNERAREPLPDSYRTICIGDSFLEDGAAIPLPVRMEERLKSRGLARHEVINLGVSATDPDEYFYRVKNIGLPMKPKHCVLLFSAASDFIQAPTLLSFGGISATYPRESLLHMIGLGSLNHVLSNNWRPMLRAWFDGGSLLEHETKLAAKFRATRNGAETEATLLSFFPAEKQQLLKDVLQQSPPEVRDQFYAVLRTPDEGKFHSHYLNLATRNAMGEAAPIFTASEYSYLWIKKTADLCRKRGVAFTLVVIPDPFSVDSRMIAQWRPVADMKAYMQSKDDATNRLIQHAESEKMDVVDLREVLRKTPGAYLNMDGHWSQYGADIVAEFLAQRFEQQALARHSEKR
ncbi:MAG: hypothetical protein A2076_02855 [Geobacteraceae bacterium GWC2_53_11]|nr:MAG: hypothetical protein A2076_02855 [Geobacteraceae bacterium GWC2_53_11]